MKREFYVHKAENKIDLDKEWDLLNNDWGRRFELPYDEGMSYLEIYLREDYFKGNCTVKPGDVVIDIGANVGIFTSLAFDMGASRVIGFEPFPKNYELAKKNNPFAEIYNLAVSDKIENIELYYTPTGCGGHSTIKEYCDSKPDHFPTHLTVRTTTLNNIIENNFLEKIDFLKVDTEGAELLIFNGLSDENLDKISSIALEYHHFMFNYDDDIYNNFLQRFLKKGFNTYTRILDKDTRMVYINKGDVFAENKKHW
jgi:FkbM family methyltransferase